MTTRPTPSSSLSLSRPKLVRATPHAQRDVTVNGMRLRYIDVGAREPDADALPLLLIHGHTSRIEEYDEVIPQLARRRRVLVPDLPGSGYSDKPDRPYSLSLYEDTLLGFLDALGIREVSAAGGSLGGNLTLRLGHREPDRFPRLAAWAPAGAWEPSRTYAALGKALGRAAARMLFWPVVWLQSRFWFDESWPHRERALRDIFAYYGEVMSPGFLRMYYELACDQLAHSHFGYAARITQPTLLAWGDRDHALDMGKGVARLRELMPRSELKVFPGARHSLANEVPEELGDVTAEFFGRALEGAT